MSGQEKRHSFIVKTSRKDSRVIRAIQIDNMEAVVFPQGVTTEFAIKTGLAWVEDMHKAGLLK